NRNLLETQDTIPFKIGTVRNINHRKVASVGAVVGAVLCELCLVFMLILELGISSECQVLHNMGCFVIFTVAYIAVTSPKLKLEPHCRCPGYIYSSTPSAGSWSHFINCMFPLVSHSLTATLLAI